MFDPDETLPCDLVQKMNEEIEYKQSGKNAVDPEDSDDMSIQQSAKKKNNMTSAEMDAPFSNDEPSHEMSAPKDSRQVKATVVNTERVQPKVHQ